jgi:hypothetical protein
MSKDIAKFPRQHRRFVYRLHYKLWRPLTLRDGTAKGAVKRAIKGLFGLSHGNMEEINIEEMRDGNQYTSYFVEVL